MVYVAYIPVFLCLIIIQTVVLPVLFYVDISYDLILIMVLFLGLYRSHAESVPVIVLLGFLVDCFSGGPFGIYTTTYLWLYIGVKSIVQYVHVNSWIVLLVGIFAGVTLEHSIVLLSVSMGKPEWQVAYEPLKTAFYQIFWALLTGPLIFFPIKAFHGGWSSWYKKSFGSKLSQDDF